MQRRRLAEIYSEHQDGGIKRIQVTLNVVNLVGGGLSVSQTAAGIFTALQPSV